MKKIEMKNDQIGLEWVEYEPRPTQTDGNVEKTIRRLRADEKVNNYGYVYRTRSVTWAGLRD